MPSTYSTSPLSIFAPPPSELSGTPPTSVVVLGESGSRSLQRTLSANGAVAKQLDPKLVKQKKEEEKKKEKDKKKEDKAKADQAERERILLLQRITLIEADHQTALKDAAKVRSLLCFYRDQPRVCIAHFVYIASSLTKSRLTSRAHGQ